MNLGGGNLNSFMRTVILWVVVLGALSINACRGDYGGVDSQTEVSGLDVEPNGGGELKPDGGVDLVEIPLEGFGSISGDCGLLDEAEWGSGSPFLFRNSVDFGTLVFDPGLLSEGGQEIERDGTAGGSSGHSEAMAYDLLYRCEMAQLLLTEMEIAYTTQDSKKTDFLISIDGHNVAVSVTRAYHYPPSDPCSEGELEALLTKKLTDAQEAAANATAENPWERTILAIEAYNAQCADTAVSAYSTLDPSVTWNTLVFITTTDGDDGFLYH